MKFLIVALLLSASSFATEPAQKDLNTPKVEPIRIHLEDGGSKEGIKTRIINEGGGAGTGGVG